MKQSTRRVFGVGVNDANYPTQIFETVDGKSKLVWICPFYRRWKSMLSRCYNTNLHEKHPTYTDCIVCEDWLIFSNFKAWMEKQEWEGNELDKDVLKAGNKCYSPDTCVFISRKVNTFTLDSGGARGEYPLGVCFHKAADKFVAQCNNPFTGKRGHIGSFDSPEEAHLAWKRRKHELACQLADSEHVTDERVARALRTRYL